MTPEHWQRVKEMLADALEREPADRPAYLNQVCTEPALRRDGMELFYLSVDRNLIVVPILNQETFQVGAPKTLFRTRLVAQGSQTPVFDTLYDVSSDGQRFLLNADPEDPGPPCTVVLNWTAGLKK